MKSKAYRKGFKDSADKNEPPTDTIKNLQDYYQGRHDSIMQKGSPPSASHLLKPQTRKSSNPFAHILAVLSFFSIIPGVHEG